MFRYFQTQDIIPKLKIASSPDWYVHHKLARTGANYPAIWEIAGYFGNKTKISLDIFSTEYPANCNYGLMILDAN